MAIHDEFAVLASELIAENGRDITLLQSGTTASDPTKPWRGQSDAATTGTPGTSIAVKGVFINQANTDDFGYREKDRLNQLFKDGRQHCLVAAQGIADVSQFDAIKDGTRIWRITNANILQPGTTRILYDFQLDQ